MQPLASSTAHLSCEAPGVTIFPSPNTAFVCSGTTINLHTGTLRIILQNAERFVTTPEVALTAQNAYLDLEATELGLTKIWLRDGSTLIKPRNELLPKITLEGGQYTEVGTETIASPVPIGQNLSTRKDVATLLFSRATLQPLGILLLSLVGITLFILLLARKRKPYEKGKIG